MTAEHKQALAQGREQSRAVRNYLEALEQNRPRRGRKRTPDSIKRRLQTIESELPDASPIQRLQMLQERRDLEAELEQSSAAVDLGALEKAFVKAAASYSDAKGISYATWREFGVPADVLQKAGITRSSG
ncbi:MAG TPA: hypothetical protein VFW74_10530 [Acidimicrobiia bacterium]|nr:hypothetical protein [Acidimicrobiia bacterium]